MLFKQCFAGIATSISVWAIIVSGTPAYAQTSLQSSQNLLDISKASQISLEAASPKQTTVQLACATCGCNEICAVTSIETTTNKSKDPSLLTDSLWGNLIIEMACQRDPQLQKLAKKLNIVNLGTMGTIFGIAGGTLGQAITAIYTLNPPDGHLDSYAPGIVGTSLSGLTMLTFGSKLYLDHKYRKQLKIRQLAIRDRVEDVLQHLEYSQAKCPEVKDDLTKLIGQRACDEFMQLWQASHQQLASSRTRAISSLLNQQPK